MNIIVTGGLGFIGSNLVDALITDPLNKIFVIDNLISESANISYKQEGVEYIIDDCVHVQEWNHIFPEKIDVIYHLAGNARIQPSFKNPLSIIRNNVLSTAAICEFARHKSAKIIYAGSSSFYAGCKNSPYSFSKWQGEEICDMYNKIYGIEIAIARFFNVYGYRQPTHGKFATVIGIFEKQYKNNEDLTIVGTGDQRRDFTHVEDICNGLISLSTIQTEGIYNLGTGTNYSINEIADIIIKNGNKDIKKKYIAERRGEANETLADISKIQLATGWQARQNLKSYLINNVKHTN